MSITKIPEYMLKSLQCAECGRYLSSAPIGTRADGTNVCSECYDDKATRCYLFETVAVLHTFPCNYKAQGCTEYLPFNDTVVHEENCKHKVHLCPVNLHSTCNWAGIPKQIYTHYKREHSELRLKNPLFNIYISKENKFYNYVISISHVDLILTAEYLDSLNILRFHAVYIGDVNSADLVKYRIKLRNSKGCGRIMELEESSTLPLTKLYQPEFKQINVTELGFLQNPEIIVSEWNFIIPNDLKQLERIKFKMDGPRCPMCTLSMVPPIYRCAFGHVLCNDCKGYEELCRICGRISEYFSRAVDLEDIAVDSQYYCRWKDCLRCFDSFTIKQHEQECSKRIYDCPICLNKIGTFNCVYKHFSSEHVNVKYISANDDLIKLSKRTDFCYVFAGREIFRVNILEEDHYKWTIDIIYYGTPSLNTWQYEVVRNCNAVYYAPKYFKNHYKLEHDEYSNRTHMQCYFSIRFIKQQGTSMMWMPYEPPSKKICLNIDY